MICLPGVTQQGHQRVQTETWVFWNPQGHSPEHQRLISPSLQILFFFVVFKELLWSPIPSSPTLVILSLSALPSLLLQDSARARLKQGGMAMEGVKILRVSYKYFMKNIC